MVDRQDSARRTLVTAMSVEGDSATLPITSSPKKAWDKLSRWIACVCVVTFDLELGQAIEVSVLFSAGGVAAITFGIEELG